MGKKQQVEVSRRRPTLQLEGFGRRRPAHIEDDGPSLENQGLEGDDSCPWKPVVEEDSGDTYYWNINTGETTWIRPPELGGGDDAATASDEPQAPALSEDSQVKAANAGDVSKKAADSGNEPENDQPLVGALESLGGYESDSGSDGPGDKSDDTASVAAVSSAAEPNTSAKNEIKSDRSAPHAGAVKTLASGSVNAAAEAVDESSTSPASPAPDASRGGSVEAATASEAAPAAPAVSTSEKGGDVEESADRDFEELVMLAGLDTENDGEPLDGDSQASAAAPKGDGNSSDPAVSLSLLVRSCSHTILRIQSYLCLSPCMYPWPYLRFLLPLPAPFLPACLPVSTYPPSPAPFAPLCRANPGFGPARLCGSAGGATK
jgi:hypothetical protein